MSTPVKHTITIYQGTTQREPFIRRYIDYAVKGNDRDGYVDAHTGTPVPDSDIHDEDYTDCTARMQLRQDVDSPEVLWEMTTENGRIELAGNTLTLIFEEHDFSDIGFDCLVGHVEVVRPNGDVERQYELRFKLSPEVTR